MRKELHNYQEMHMEKSKYKAHLKVTASAGARRFNPLLTEMPTLHNRKDIKLDKEALTMVKPGSNLCGLSPQVF